MRPNSFAVAVGLAVVLVGCGGAAPSVAPSVTPTPAPTATPRPTPPATASPSPTPTPLPSTAGESGGELAEAVVAALNADPLVVHVEQTGTVESAQAPGVVITADGSYDFSGDDLHVTITIGGIGQTIETEIIVVGDTTWVRSNGGAWESSPTSALGDTIGEMAAAIRLVGAADDLRHVGTEVIDGRELQHLTAARTIPYAPAGGGTGRYDVFDIYVEDDGTPVLVRTAYSAEDANGIQASGSTDFVFSEYGGPIVIEPPAD